MRPKLPTQLVRGVALALLAAALPVYGETADLFPQDPPLSSAELAALRGGFSHEGIRFDFGIERVVIGNGITEPQTVFRFGSRDFKLSGGASSILPTLPLLIRNRLDQQQIKVLTMIDVRIGNLRAVRSGAMEAALAIPSVLPRR